ncbi:hypothetical protein fHeYen902_278 [Yersinia phage fHe-Yen9-02]|nr:hypothetical protein fHeYen902_278 [Yersinia phage fHe-Yen9-02]
MLRIGYSKSSRTWTSFRSSEYWNANHVRSVRAKSQQQ